MAGLVIRMLISHLALSKPLPWVVSLSHLGERFQLTFGAQLLPSLPRGQGGRRTLRTRVLPNLELGVYAQPA